ncbi:MAG: bifunctional UDP-N-acetylglucosamine diphosphorylase/glucosamine-1-phosphate N-acetyltransferase GlmU [Anaerolineae bacterium]
MLSVIILAAGKSTRFKSETPKVLHPLGGRPMLQYTLDLANKLTAEPPIVVVGPETEQHIRDWAGERARCVLQQERRGTGHAVQQAQPLLQGRADQILVLYGDMPLLRVDTVRHLVAIQKETEATIALLTIERDNPRGFGRIVRDADDRIRAIVEEAEATPEIAAIRELNTGVAVFAADFLWSHLAELKPSPRKGEYYLTDLIGIAVAEDRPVEGLQMEEPSEGLGINTRVDLSAATAALRRRVNEELMLSGVTFVDPATTYVDVGVTVGRDTIIYPNTHLHGETTIGEACEIGPNTIIENCTIGNHCRVTVSVLENAVMEDDSNIGPFGHLRTGARLSRGAHMGNFGEMKNSTLGPNSKMGHFSYLGDADVGANVNIGAGTITCNFDGKNKHPTTIEDGVFIGSDTMLVAPVRISAGARTGAGSVVTRDLPSNSLAYGVPARIVQPKPRPTIEESEESETDGECD